MAANGASTFEVNIKVPFPTKREADIAYQVLRVDAEPKRSGVTKVLEVADCILNVNFVAPELRKLRVGVTSFMNHLILVTETMDQFGPPLSDKYAYD